MGFELSTLALISSTTQPPDELMDLLERPHPQSAGITKSQRRIGTRKRPPQKNHN